MTLKELCDQAGISLQMRYFLYTPDIPPFSRMYSHHCWMEDDWSTARYQPNQESPIFHGDGNSKEECQQNLIEKIKGRQIFILRKHRFEAIPFQVPENLTIE